jgi:outer membrane cobalamin receptor
MRYRSPIAAVLLQIVASSSSRAESPQAEAEAAGEVEEITITATRVERTASEVSAAVSVIDRDQLDAKAARITPPTSCRRYKASSALSLTCIRR